MGGSIGPTKWKLFCQISDRARNEIFAFLHRHERRMRKRWRRVRPCGNVLNEGGQTLKCVWAHQSKICLFHLTRTSSSTHFTSHALHWSLSSPHTHTSSNTHFISLKRTSLKLSLAPINTNTHQPHTCIHDQLVLVHQMCKQIMFRPNNGVCLHPQLIECI